MKVKFFSESTTLLENEVLKGTFLTLEDEQSLFRVRLKNGVLCVQGGCEEWLSIIPKSTDRVYIENINITDD